LTWGDASLGIAGWWITFTTVKRRGTDQGKEDKFLIPVCETGEYNPAAIISRFKFLKHFFLLLQFV